MIVGLAIAIGVTSASALGLGLFALLSRIADHLARWRDWRRVQRQWRERRDELRVQLPPRERR